MNESVRVKSLVVLQKWLGSVDPNLSQNISSLSSESLAKLEAMRIFNEHANKDVAETIATLQQCTAEYDALYKEGSKQLALFGLDPDELSSIVKKSLQESAHIVNSGRVGDGSDAGAALQLTSDVLESLAVARLKMNMKNNVKTMARKNIRLGRTLKFYEKERDAAMEEKKEIHSRMKDCVVENSHYRVKGSKFEEIAKTVRGELETMGIDSSLSDQALMEIYEAYLATENEINEVKKRLKKFGDLPPNILEASEKLEETKKELASVVEQFKQKLASHSVNF